MSSTAKNWAIGILGFTTLYLLYRHNKYKTAVKESVTASELATITEKTKGF